jgi:hypothetical protein
VVTGVIIVFNVFLRRLELAGKSATTAKIDRYALWIYPIFYVAAFAAAALFSLRTVE